NWANFTEHAAQAWAKMFDALSNNVTSITATATVCSGHLHQTESLPTLADVRFTAKVHIHCEYTLIRRGDGSLGRHEPISDTEFGQQDARLGRIDLDLLPQLAHEDAQIMRVVQVRRAPDLLEQELVGDDVSRVLRQELQQPIF